MRKDIIYGRTHEKGAVEAYSTLSRSQDVELEVNETGQHIHKQYPFLAASPDRNGVLDGEQGSLEVNTLFPKRVRLLKMPAKTANFAEC